MLINRVSSQPTFQANRKLNQISFTNNESNNKQLTVTNPEIAAATGTTAVGATIGGSNIFTKLKSVITKKSRKPILESNRAITSGKYGRIEAQVKKLEEAYKSTPTKELKNELDSARKVLKKLSGNPKVRKFSSIGAAIGAAAALAACAITKLVTAKTAVEPE